jgi:hypothetical protein
MFPTGRRTDVTNWIIHNIAPPALLQNEQRGFVTGHRQRQEPHQLFEILVITLGAKGRTAIEYLEVSFFKILGIPFGFMHRNRALWDHMVDGVPT